MIIIVYNNFILKIFNFIVFTILIAPINFKNRDFKTKLYSNKGYIFCKNNIKYLEVNILYFS